MNNSNFGIFVGRLTKDPVYFANKDGSYMVSLHLACQQNFASGKDKTYESDFIEFRGFIPRSTANKGIYSYLGTGCKVSVQYTLRSSVTSKNGTKTYYQNPFIESLQILEGKAYLEKKKAAKEA